MLRIVETVGHYVKETGGVSFHSPQIMGIYLTHGTVVLDKFGIFVPIPDAQSILVQPCTLVPYEHQVIGEVPAEPLMRTVRTVHAHRIHHVLVGDSIEPEFPYESLQLFRRAFLLNAPDSLGKGVCAAPGTHPDGTRVVLVSQPDEKVAARRIIPLADNPDASPRTTHDRTAAYILRTGPVSERLRTLFLLAGEESFLSRPFHKIGDIHGVAVNHTVEILRPFLRIRITVPSDGGDDGFYLETVCIGQQADGRLVVVRLDLRRTDVSANDNTGLQRIRGVRHGIA